MPNITLMQGDCLELMKQLPDKSVDLVLTDIPYNEVNRKSMGLRKLNKGIADEINFALNDFLEGIYRISSGTIICFCGMRQFSEIYRFFGTKRGTVRPIVWEKSNPSPMNGQHIYLSGVELAVWFKKPGAKTFNAHCKNTVFKHPSGRSKYHPTEKNHKLIEELIFDNSDQGQTVFDPCMGSGSHGIVAIKNNRNFIGMELDPHYFEIAKKRIEDAERAKAEAMPTNETLF